MSSRKLILAIGIDDYPLEHIPNIENADGDAMGVDDHKGMRAPEEAPIVELCLVHVRAHR